MTDSSTFAPDWISPPGDTIEDLLEERSWTKAEFAERTGFTPKHINELVKGRVPITADAAERLSRVLGSTSDFWLVRDAQYQAACERQRAIKSAVEDAAWLSPRPRGSPPRSWDRPAGGLDLDRPPPEETPRASAGNFKDY